MGSLDVGLRAAVQNIDRYTLTGRSKVLNSKGGKVLNVITKTSILHTHTSTLSVYGVRALFVRHISRYYTFITPHTVRRFRRLRGQGCVYAEICVCVYVTGCVHAHPRCLYSPSARVNAPHNFAHPPAYTRTRRCVFAGDRRTSCAHGLQALVRLCGLATRLFFFIREAASAILFKRVRDSGLCSLALPRAA